MKRYLIPAVMLVVFIGSFFFFSFRYPVDDLVSFTGDSFDYQGLAVNFLKGHGYREGCFEGQDIYKIDHDARDPVFKEYFRPITEYTFYRAPGYPLFMTAVYAIGGIHPRNVKIAQMGLLAFCAAALVWLGYAVWGESGIVTGVVAGVFYTVFLAPRPDNILTEPLLAFALAIWGFCYVFWKQSRSMIVSVVLGVATTILFLIKEIFIFIPLIWAIYYVFIFRGDTLVKKISVTLLFFLGFGAAFSPWSLYAHTKRGEWILTTTHTEHALLDGNNEDTFKNGKWRGEWRKKYPGDPRYFYNREEMKNKPYVAKYLAFMHHYRKDLGALFMIKLKRAYAYNKFVFWGLILMFIYYVVFWARSCLKNILTDRGWRFLSEAACIEMPLMFFVNITALTLILFAEERFTLAHMYFFILCAVHAVVLGLYGASHRLKGYFGSFFLV